MTSHDIPSFPASALQWPKLDSLISTSCKLPDSSSVIALVVHLMVDTLCYTGCANIVNIPHTGHDNSLAAQDFRHIRHRVGSLTLKTRGMWCRLW